MPASNSPRSVPFVPPPTFSDVEARRLLQKRLEAKTPQDTAGGLDADSKRAIIARGMEVIFENFGANKYDNAACFEACVTYACGTNILEVVRFDDFSGMKDQAPYWAEVDRLESLGITATLSAPHLCALAYLAMIQGVPHVRGFDAPL